MKARLVKTFSFLRTTAVGGLIFLLPLAVLIALLGYVYDIVQVAYAYIPLKDLIPVHTAVGVAILFVAATAGVLAACFFAGLAARRALGRRFSETLEKQLVMVFPKYAIYKDIVAGNIGGDDLTPTLQPVTLAFDDHLRIGYEAGRTTSGLVIAFLPGAPDPWIGAVVLIEPDRVTPLEVDFTETAAICERLGRDSTELLAKIMPRRTN